MEAKTIKTTKYSWYVYHLREYAAVLGFSFLFILQALFISEFFSTTNLINVARQISVNAILAVGMTFVIISGGIDLSVGSGVAFLGVCSALLSTRGANFFLTLVITVLLGALMGLFNGLIITRAEIPPFIVTLATLSIVRGGALAISSGQSVSGLDPIYRWIGRGYIGPIPFPVCLMLAIFLIGHFILAKTRLGRYTYAIGGNENVSEIVGIHIRQIKVRLYIISGILTAVSALILTSRLNSGQPLIGQGYELDAVASVVLGGCSLFGGTGNLIGTFFGAAIIGILTNGLTLMNLSFYYQLAVKGIVIIIAVWIAKERRKKR
jgi:ribose transport system permease protein